MKLSITNVTVKRNNKILKKCIKHKVMNNCYICLWLIEMLAKMLVLRRIICQWKNREWSNLLLAAGREVSLAFDQSF